MSSNSDSTSKQTSIRHGVEAERQLAEWMEGNFDGRRFSLKKGCICVVSCGTSTCTWLIKKGTLFGMLRGAEADKELAYSFFRKGQIAHAMEPDKTVELHALTDATLVQFPSSSLNDAIRKDPRLSSLLAEHYHARFQETLRRYRQAALISSEERLAALERELSAIDGLDPADVDDSTLALFLGMHRVSVNKLRKKLKRHPPPHR